MGTPPLDHLILLVRSLEPEVVSFLSSAGFDLLPGGTHADGRTENTLIILPDGIYIEVIAFTPATTPERRAEHWWGKKADGWVDWALGPPPLTAAERVSDANAKAGKKLYDEPVAGGRVTTDGKVLKWKVAFPVVHEGERRGVAPFWCEDITERAWRVPGRSVEHPNGAIGVKSITLLSKLGGLSAYTSTLGHILSPPTTPSPSHQFELATPAGGVVNVFVREPKGSEETEWVEQRGEGLFEVEIATAGGSSAVKFGAKEGARFVV